MNTELLGLWMSVICLPIGGLLVIAFLVTGKKTTALRIVGGLFMLLGFAGFAMSRYL